MKSGKQRRIEIKLNRIEQAKKVQAQLKNEALKPSTFKALGALAADQQKLLHDNTYGPRPKFYLGIPFTCIDCGSEEIWTAKQQKWWYEIAEGKIASTAVRCRPCRKNKQMIKAEARRIHLEGLAAKNRS